MSRELDRLRETIEARAAGRGVVGLAVSTGKPEAVWTPTALDAEPSFLAYSITKTFIAVLALLLQEQGRLRLDDPLTRWFPALLPAQRISLRQLLNHTAGLRDYGGLAAYHEAVRSSPGEPWSFERFVEETVEKGLLFQPGERFAYSNPGTMLLRRVLEEVAQERLAGLIRDRIARPLGLVRTFAAESVADLAALAPAPSTRLSSEGRRLDVRAHYHPGWVSHGVIASTASELCRFLDALFAGALLAPDSLREMTRTVPVLDAPPHWRRPRYGLGLMADEASPWGALFGHGGGGPGYVAAAFHAADLAASVCAMCAIEDEQLAEQLALDALPRVA